MLWRDRPADTLVNRAVAAAMGGLGEVVHAARRLALEAGAIGPTTRRGRRFGAMGDGSVICFPAASIFNEQHIAIGVGTLIGPHATLSVGMAPGQQMLSPIVVRIGDRCVLGRGSGVVGHLSIDIGDDVWTGHHVYITDQNHGYEELDMPIARQWMPERPVSIGAGSWIGHGAVVLPGATIGRHVVIGANSVVAGEIPDYAVAAGSPARVIKSMRSAGVIG
ncbi:MAG: acyltransferase [Ilumatobacteraceae bacterium]